MKPFQRRDPAPGATAPRRRRRVPVGALLALLLVGGAATAMLTREHRMGLLLAAPANASTPLTPPPPTELLALPGRAIANGTHRIAITLSAPPAPGSPPPTLSPAAAGSWRIVGDSEVFTPASTLNPCSSYRLTIWAQTTATGATPLGRRRVIGLNVACPPIKGLQQTLARLGYLGARFRPSYLVHLASGPESRHEAAVRIYHPPRGRLVADPSDAPPVDLGHLDAATRGALEVYQEDRGLEVTGEPNQETWESLLSEDSSYRRDPHPYTWVSVSESLPETLEVHRGHHVALSTPANTGVPGAETERGVFPIYSRFVSTTMSGTDVDGTKYVVPDVPWVNYFNGGDAVHGYARASYGFPQSNGCVELPIEAAGRVFGMLQIGDLVEVS